MTRTIEIASNAAASAWTDLTGVIPWPGSMWGGMAHALEVGTESGFDLDDDAGTRTLPAKRVVRCIETATSPDTVLFKGRVSDKGVARSKRWSGDAKAYDASLDDNNSQVFGIPVDRWTRPSETGWARVQAAMAQFAAGDPRASTVIDATTYAPNTNTTTMPAQTYDATDLGGVLRDCAQTEGKQVFVTVDDELFYDLDTSTSYAAGLAITDDAPNETDEFAPIEPHGSEEGNEFYSGATIRYGAHSSESDVRTTAESDHDYWRTVIYDSDAKASTAAQRLATLLDNQSVEEKRYTCDLQLTAAQVDLIKYGHTVSFRSAAAGVLTPVTLRVASLYWEPIGVDMYVAHLELGVPEKLGPRVRRGTPPPPAPFVCEQDFFVKTTGGADDMAAVFPNHANGQRIETDDDPANMMTVYDTAEYRIDYLVFHAADSNHLYASLYAFGGSNIGPTTADMGDLANHCTFDPPSDIPAASVTWTADFTGYVQASLVEGACVAGDSFGSSISAHIFYLSGPDPRFEGLGPCSNGIPAGGQAVEDTSFLGDGSTTTYTTDHGFAYRALSLRVFVNGLDWTSQVTESDPDTGEYELAYPPPLDATVRVFYVAV